MRQRRSAEQQAARQRPCEQGGRLLRFTQLRGCAGGGMLVRPRPGRLPSEIVRSQVYTSFQRDISASSELLTSGRDRNYTVNT